MINDRDSQRLAEWVDSNLYRKTHSQNLDSMPQLGFEVISETENLLGQYCFKLDAGVLQLEPAGFLTADQYLGFKFGHTVHPTVASDPDPPQTKIFYKSHTELVARPTSNSNKVQRVNGVIVAKLRDMVNQQFGILGFHKMKILRKVSSHFIQPDIRYLFEKAVVPDRYRLMNIEEFKSQLGSSKKFYASKLEDLCIEMMRYFRYKIEAAESPQLGTNMNQLVYFTSRAISIRLTEYLLELNEKIIQYWSEYLTFSPWTVVDSQQIEMSSVERERKANLQLEGPNFNPSLEEIGFLTAPSEVHVDKTLPISFCGFADTENLQLLKDYSMCFDTSTFLRVTSILKQKLPHLQLEKSIEATQKHHVKHMITNEFERDKLMLKTAVKGFLMNRLRPKYPGVLNKQALLRVELCDSVNLKSKHLGDGREDRILERKQARSFFYGQDPSVASAVFESKLGSLMDATYRKSKNNLQQTTNATSSGEIRSGNLGNLPGEADTFSNTRLFEWVSLDKFLVRPDTSFKNLFGMFSKFLFEHLTALDCIDLSKLSQFDIGIKDPLAPANSSESNRRAPAGSAFKFPVHLPESALDELFALTKSVFKQSLLGLVAYLFVLDMFSYLFTQKESLTPDLFGVSVKTEEEVFELEESLHSEMSSLAKDHEYISLYMPDNIQIGIFALDLSKFKQDSLKEIRDNIRNIRRTCQTELKKISESLERNIEEITDTCSQVPDSVDSYIRLKKKMQSREFEARICKAKAQSQALQVLLGCLEFPGGDAPDPKDLKALVRHLQLKAALATCLETHSIFSTEFKGAKFNFFADIGLHKTETLAEFEGL